MTCQILQFPQRKKRKASESYLLAFMALLGNCPCEECQHYLRLLETDEAEAERFLIEGGF